MNIETPTPTSDVPVFTARQQKNWKAYERVRESGKYNMFSPRARRATGLSAEDYSFTMKYFSELQAAVKEAP